MTTSSPTAPPAQVTLHDTGDHGLICGYRFGAGAVVGGIGCEQAALWLADPHRADDQLLWLHFNLGHAGAERWLRAHAGLDEAFYEALHEGSRSSRIERVLDSLFAVVNDVTFDFAYEASDVATLWVSVQRHLVVSARRRPLRSVDRLRAEVRQGVGVASAPQLLDRLLRDQADELQRITRTATERVDAIEDAVLVGRTGRLAAEASQLRRMAVRLQRLLAPEPAAFMRMLANPPAWVLREDVQSLQQASEEFAVVLRDVGALQERIKLLQDEAAARVAEQNNRSLFVLTMVTVLALPINLGAGLLGMNVGGIPLAEHPHGFLIVVACIGGVTALLAWLAVRRLRAGS